MPNIIIFKVRLHDATKLMRHATCNTIALCKRAYLCDMRLLHAVAGKLKSSNFLATITLHGRMFLLHRVNAPLRYSHYQHGHVRHFWSGSTGCELKTFKPCLFSFISSRTWNHLLWVMSFPLLRNSTTKLSNTKNSFS